MYSLIKQDDGQRDSDCSFMETISAFSDTKIEKSPDYREGQYIHQGPDYWFE
jgi:hypothetical protein